MTTEKPRPVHEIRLGRVKAAIWDNSTPTEKGDFVRYGVTFSRLYFYCVCCLIGRKSLAYNFSRRLEVTSQ